MIPSLVILCTAPGSGGGMSTESAFRKFLTQLNMAPVVHDKNDAPAKPSSGTLDGSPDVQRTQLLDALGRRNEATRLKFQNIIASWDAISSLHKELSDGFNDIFNIMASLSEAEKTIFELNVKIDNLTSDYIQVKKDLAALLVSSKAEQEELEFLRIKKVADELKIQSLESEVKDLARSADDKATEIRNLASQIDIIDREKDLLGQECRSLAEAVRKMELDKTELLNERANLRNRISVEVQERANASNLANSLSAQVSDQNRKIAALNAQLSEVEKERDTMRSLHEQEKSELSRSLQEHQNRIASLNSEVMTLRSSESLFSHRIDALNSRVRIGDKLLQQARDEVSRLAMNDLELKEKIREREFLSAQLAEVEKKNAILEQDLSSAREELAERGSAAATLRSEVEKARELLARANDRIASLERDVAGWEKRSDEASARSANEVSELKSRLLKQQTETAYLNGVIEAARADRIKLQELISEMRRDATGRMKERADFATHGVKKDSEIRKPVRPKPEFSETNVVTMRGAE